MIFEELTEEQDALVDNALNGMRQDELLVDEFNIPIRRRDIETLAGLNWLNDEVIFFYMNLIMERGKNENSKLPTVYAFNTFFYPKLLQGGHAALKRWTRKLDLFAYDLIIVPVHLGAHWCLAVSFFY